ncbi:MAG: tRNA (adenosine(37)-N6)-threonylcarbamoyltransferase complex ATPase subunit type 1 TsaE [Anaerolineae bacterium]|nr:tRNA (adenosine(37)-N6)-threonylcarbamoyltransferase complex ATPase subunit type 1 TsaE [Anaerolineae bacterium]
MSDNDSITCISTSIEHTTQLGQQLGTLLSGGDVVCLSGDLGAGKTALTRGIGAGWGAQEPVTSPTFTLIHEHRRVQDAQLLYHVDCYRLSSANETWSIGLDDMLHSDHVTVIEWPENISGVLRVNRLWIDLLFVDDTQRKLMLHATGARYQALLATLRSSGWGA